MSEVPWQAVCHTQLQAWQASGLDRCDPVRVRHIQRLLTRASSQPHAVQQVLAARVAREIEAYETRWCGPSAEPLQNPPSLPTTSKPALPASTALADLTAYLSTMNRAEPVSSLAGDESVASDMKSVRRFSQVWSHIAAEQQVKQALTRGPENAGPLNAHRLMLRSLALMQSLSPDYLRRFLSQVDALLWIEQVNQKNALGDARDKTKKIKATKKA